MSSVAPRSTCISGFLLCVLGGGGEEDAVLRTLTSHQRGPGSNPSVDAICGLSLLMVLSFIPRGFSPGTPL